MSEGSVYHRIGHNCSSNYMVVKKIVSGKPLHKVGHPSIEPDSLSHHALLHW